MSVATRPMQTMRLGPIAGAVALAALAASVGLAISLGSVKLASQAAPGTAPSAFDNALQDFRALEVGNGTAGFGEALRDFRAGEVGNDAPIFVPGYHPGGWGGPRADDTIRPDKDDVYVAPDTGTRGPRLIAQ